MSCQVCTSVLSACFHARTYIFTYVRMYVCMHACMYACLYICMYVCMFVCIHVFMYPCLHAYNDRFVHVYLLQVSSSSGTWTCKKCTLENPISKAVCEACGHRTSRPATPTSQGTAQPSKALSIFISHSNVPFFSLLLFFSIKTMKVIEGLNVEIMYS